MTSSQFYLPFITLWAMICLPSPNFGYAVVTTPSATWGNIFTFLASMDHAVAINMFVLGLYALYTGASASRFLNLHVVLAIATYLAAHILKFFLWESDKIMWTSMASALPADLMTIVVTPFVLFNLALLPLSFLVAWRCAGTGGISGGCVDVTVAA